MTSSDEQDRADLDLLLRGFQVSRLLRLVADLGVADVIGVEDQVAVTELSSRCDVESAPLLRVLRTLAAFGVFRVESGDIIGHTPRSRLLRTDTPNTLHHAARFWTAPGSWKAWGALDVAMKGDVPHEAAWEQSRFTYLGEHPDEARVFDAMMANLNDRHAALAAGYDFSAAGLVADIGGGNGTALRHILGRCPTAHGLLFDLEHVVRAVDAAALMDGRITTVGGSFFDGVPSGADFYLLIQVLHDWPDDECLRILRNCRDAIEPHGVLLVGEHVLEPNPAKGRAVMYLVDVQMMAMFGHARERTEHELRTLLAESGFAWKREIRTASSVSFIEATPV